MTRITKRRAASIAAVVLLLVSGVYVFRVASILAAYKAKMLCSEVFLARRDPDTVRAELEVDDLAPLRYISDSLDITTMTVTSTVAGVIREQAVYRGDRGCVLLFGSPSREHRLRIEVGASAGDGSEAPSPRLEAVLDRAFAEPNPQRPRRTRAIVVVQDGRILAERYAPGFTPATPLIGWSMTKTVMNALVGILVGEGRLAIDRPVPIPEWQAADDPRRQITLDQLLHMSSGLQFDESPWNPVSDVTVMLLGRPDAGLYAAEKRLANPPGTTWQYSSGTTNISGDAVLPADAFHAIGHAGQFVTMIPSANVVVVRLGLTRYPDAWDHTAFVRDVIDAVGGTL